MLKVLSRIRSRDTGKSGAEVGVWVRSTAPGKAGFARSTGSGGEDRKRIRRSLIRWSLLDGFFLGTAYPGGDFVFARVFLHRSRKGGLRPLYRDLWGVFFR